MSKLNFIRDIIEFWTRGPWSPLNAAFTVGNLTQEDTESGADECAARRRGPVKRSRSSVGPRRKKPCNLVTAWRQMNCRHRMLVAEVCEALLDLHLSDETPATKTDILREMDERGTKPEVRRMFQNKPPTVEEFNTAFRYTTTYGLLRPERSSNGKYKYCLEEKLREVLENVRSGFDDVITELGQKTAPSRR